MVCSWQFPLVSGLLQMTDEEEEEECEGRKTGGVFLFHVFFPSLARGDDGASARHVL